MITGKLSCLFLVYVVEKKRLCMNATKNIVEKDLLNQIVSNAGGGGEDTVTYGLCDCATQLCILNECDHQSSGGLSSVCHKPQ